MLSNPPYGKSWKTDLDRMGGKSEMTDHRFVIEHAEDPEYSLITRVNDGQMMFLANMLSKMKHDTPFGSRIAEVHNGSSLFTGDAGQGESNIRRWIIENDWLEAIVALPLNMFYNTGIATYVWVITNRKPTHRRGYAQLIDRHQVVHTPTPEPRPEELRDVGFRHRQNHRHVHGVRGNRTIKDLPQRRIRLLEGHCRAPAAHSRQQNLNGSIKPPRSGNSGMKASATRTLHPSSRGSILQARHQTRCTDCSPPPSRARLRS